MKSLQNRRFFAVHRRRCGGVSGSPRRCYARPFPTPGRSTPSSVEHTVEHTAESLWSDLSRRLRETLNESTYGTWFGEAGPGRLDADAFQIVVGNDFTREWIEGHFLGLIKAAARDALGREVRISITVRDVEPPVGRSPEQREPARRPPRRSRAPTRSTPSTTSSSARRTASRMPRRWRSRRRPHRPTTRCSSTAARGSGRRTCCRRSAPTSASTRGAGRPAT